MKRRLFLYTTLLLFIGLFSFFGMSVYITHNNDLKLAKDLVMETAQNYAGLFNDNTDFASFVKTSGDMRISIIASDGKVLADSRPLDIASLENHLNRPEVQAAASGSPEAFIRYSDSLGVDMIYYALKIANDDAFIFIRTAVPVAKIDSYLLQSLPLLIIVLFIITMLCFAFARKMIINFTKPFKAFEHKLRLLASGEYSLEPVADSYEEISLITQSIDEVAQILQKSIQELNYEKTKLNYILDNIGNGLIVLDGAKNITLINSSAINIFGVNPDIVGKNLNYLTFDQTLVKAVNECVTQEKIVLFDLTLNGYVYMIAVKRLPGAELTMVALSDVTENRENAIRREEFFANASHELKTPLTAIKGFNELMAINNKDEKISKFIEGIARETERMLTLIGDMLKLSELENTQNIKPVSVGLAQVINEVQGALSSVITDKSLTFESIGDAIVYAEQQHVYELVKNLIENAVRYNDPGGRVSVTIEYDKKDAVLCIFDDGIGISPEEQTRIFERFYRVEKSRSVQSGGTGLGLSIVKHICSLYNWNVSLKSKLGVGTEVTVFFNR
ncbi:MAG: ATP-binding protein [Firmicutes bacterium]|nr:ATP-binding protein [Bacillota bacterium]